MKRLKIAIETSTSCVGTCSGCALTSAQRLSQIPVLNDLNKFFINLKKYYEDVLNYNKSNDNDFEYVVIELVVGEHFNFTDEYLVSLLSYVKIFLESTDKKYILAISSSGLLLRNKIEEKLKLVSSIFDKKNLEIHLICNLNEMEKFKNKYDDVLNLFQNYFSFTNLLVNFDNQLKLENCDLLASLITKYKITDFQLVYGLKQHNIHKVGHNNQLFYDVYNRILKTSSNGFRQNDIYTEMKKYTNKIDDVDSMQELIFSTVDKWFDEQIFISHDGEIFNLISTMLGGIELDERAGFKEITTIYDNNAFENYIHYKGHVKKELFKNYLKNKVCFNCKIKEECYSVGVPLLVNNLVKDNICFNPILSFYEHAEELVNKYDNEILKDFKVKDD